MYLEECHECVLFSFMQRTQSLRIIPTLPSVNLPHNLVTEYATKTRIIDGLSLIYGLNVHSIVFIFGLAKYIEYFPRNKQMFLRNNGIFVTGFINHRFFVTFGTKLPPIRNQTDRLSFESIQEIDMSFFCYFFCLH